MKKLEKKCRNKKTFQHVLQIGFQGISRFKQLPARQTMVRWIQGALSTDATMTIRFVEEEEGRQLNAQYRGKDYATNVLTFDYAHEPVIADLVICVPVLVRESEQQNKTFKEHLAHLLVHGTLHAQGYDHMDDEEATEMEQEETYVLTALGFEVPYPDRDYKLSK